LLGHWLALDPPLELVVAPFCPVSGGRSRAGMNRAPDRFVKWLTAEKGLCLHLPH
jgi:hypothetical protein